MVCFRNIPKMVALWTPFFTLLMFIVTYSVSSHFKHVTNLLPFLSDVIKGHPETVIYGFMLHFISPLWITFMYVRYMEISAIIKMCSEETRFKKFMMNSSSYAIGITSIIMNIASYHAIDDYLLHLILKMIYYILLTVYCAVQATLSMDINPRTASKCQIIMRWFLVIVQIVSVIGSYLIYDIIYFGIFDPSKYENSPWWTIQRYGSIFEWLLNFAFCVFLCTFLYEFSTLKLHSPRVIYINRLTFHVNRNNRRQQHASSTQNENLSIEILE